MAARRMSPALPIPPRVDDAEWAEFLYFRANPRGLTAERWRQSAAAAGSSTACATRSATAFFTTYPPARRSRISRRSPRGGPMTPAFAPRRAAASIAPGRSRFTFDGKTYDGYAGDTLASALLANGVHLVGRSYKYHRPRGILSGGRRGAERAGRRLARAPGRFTPNLRATQVALYDGLVAVEPEPLAFARLRSRRGQRSPVAAVLGRLLLQDLHGPAGARRNWAWKRVYEPIIRRAAGLGTPPTEPDPDRLRPAITSIATCSSSAPGRPGSPPRWPPAPAAARVILCDEQQRNGRLAARRNERRDRRPSAADWLARTLSDLAALPNVRLMPRTQAFGYYAQNFVALSETRGRRRRRTGRRRAARAAVAGARPRSRPRDCGAIERPLVFPDNDRPGVMLADAARAFLNRYGVKVGARRRRGDRA